MTEAASDKPIVSSASPPLDEYRRQRLDLFENEFISRDLRAIRCHWIARPHLALGRCLSSTAPALWVGVHSQPVFPV
jgi:hypothetical protein